MKLKTIFLCLILFLEINANFLRVMDSSTNNFDYSSYKAVSSNTDLTSQTLSSSTSDQSVVYITESGKKITDSNLNKESGESSNIENSEFYGVNAAVLVQGGDLTISGGTITTKTKGANALCVTNNGKVTISETKIISTASSSGRGLHATYGGEITASKVEISSTGGSCATLATDRGEGTVTCSECTLSTAGAGSPLIYSTGNILVSQSTGTATGAQAVVVEGKNTATVKDSSELKCSGKGNTDTDIDKCGVMLYQSMSGDADSGTSTFNCQSSTISIESSSSVYSSAPMFFITNTDAQINIDSCTFSYGSNIFLKTGGTSRWGSTGSNGGVVTLNLRNQAVVGNFIIDEYSGLTINLENSSIEGTINSDKTGAKVEINLDEKSSITLTGNSYYTSLNNGKENGDNINKGTYKFESYEEKEISRPSSSGNGDSHGSGQGEGDPHGPGEGGDPHGPGEGGDSPFPSNLPTPPPGNKPEDDSEDEGEEENYDTYLRYFYIIALISIVEFIF